MKKHVLSLLLVPTLLMAFFATTAFTNAPAAHAATRAANTSGNNVRNAFINGTMYDPLARVVLAPGTDGSITQTYGYSNTWGASVTVNGGVVQAALNYNITASYSLSSNCHAANTSNHDKELVFTSVSDVWNYTVYNGNTQVGTGYAYQYINQTECNVYDYN